MTFDPFGCVFRFFLKHRRVGENNVQDLFIERMYTREDCGVKPIQMKSAPRFTPTVPTAPTVDMGDSHISFDTLNYSDSQGAGFDDEPREETPF